jgi:hypothetical protein
MEELRRLELRVHGGALHQNSCRVREDAGRGDESTGIRDTDGFHGDGRHREMAKLSLRTSETRKKKKKKKKTTTISTYMDA